MHDLIAPGLTLQRPLNAFDLASDASHARQQFLLIANA
jgi:hypothetical protein